MSKAGIGRRNAKIAPSLAPALALCAAVLAAVVAATTGRTQAASQATVATAWVGLHGARVRLIAGPAAGGGARTYLAGVEVALAEGWKTYWRMPGDAGVPPSFNWADSANTAAIKVLYPAPVRLIEPAAETIGYKGSVVFPVEVKPLDAGKPVELSLALELGICREICIPGEARLSLTIPPAGLAGASPVSAWRERVPRPQATRGPGDPELKGVVATLEGPSPRLLIEATFRGGASAGDVFIEAPDGLYVPMAKRLPDGPGGIVRFEADLSRVDAHDLKGKELTVTLVGDGGAATEATWQLR
jgi:DsbC/DsbD-like thiol-disulfide interchange protein